MKRKTRYLSDDDVDNDNDDDGGELEREAELEERVAARVRADLTPVIADTISEGFDATYRRLRERQDDRLEDVSTVAAPAVAGEGVPADYIADRVASRVSRELEDLREDAVSMYRSAERNGGLLTAADRDYIRQCIREELDTTEFGSDAGAPNDSDDDEGGKNTDGKGGKNDAGKDASRRLEDRPPGEHEQDEARPVVIYVPGHDGPLSIDWEATLR